MEITAAGPFGLGAVSTGTASGEGAGGAFAAVLGAFGSTGTAAAPATPPLSAAGPTVPLLVGTAATQDTPPQTAVAEVPLPPGAAVADGEALSALIVARNAETPQPMPVSPELTAPATGMKADKGGKPVPKGQLGTADLALPGGDAVPVTAEALPVDVAAKTEIVPEVNESLQQPEQSKEVAAEVPTPPAPPAHNIVSPQATANVQPTHQSKAQATDTLVEKAQETVSVVNPPDRQAPAESGASAKAPDGPAEPVAEPFARMVPNMAPERAQPQANAAQLPSHAAAPVQAQIASQPAAHTAPGEAHPTVSFRSDKMAEEMGLEIARRVSAGGDELVIRMDPAELGRINIRMAVNEQGQLRAIVSADAPAVLEALRSDVSELNRALEQAGVRTDSQSFRFDRGGSGDPGSQWQQRYQQQNGSTRQGEGNAFAAADDEPAYRPMATNGRVNMMA